MMEIFVKVLLENSVLGAHLVSGVRLCAPTKLERALSWRT